MSNVDFNVIMFSTSSYSKMVQHTIADR